MRKKSKISIVELVTVIIMILCYEMALFLLTENEKNYALLFFVLHGILTMVCLYIFQIGYEKMLLDEKEVLLNRIGEDISQKEQLLVELQDEKKKLEERIKELTSEVDHIRQENDTLLDEIAKKEQESGKYVQDNSMLLPVNEQVRDVDLLLVIKKVFDVFEQTCRDNGIRLELATSFEQVKLRCDERYLIAMLNNIVDNAIKYMNRNGSLVITISDVGEQGVFIVCKDNGEGLDAQESAYIFDLNYQGSNRKSGNGLGLAQVKAIVEHYNGTVYVKSKPGQGMGIYIQFPV